MYIYRTGAVGEAVREMIENTKSSIQTGSAGSTGFTDVLRTKLDSIDTDTKTVGMDHSDSSSLIGRTDASTILYALQNADTDTTAAAVVSSLGLASSADSTSKTDADKLVSAINLFKASEGADDTVLKTQLADIVPKFNALLGDLATQSTNSGYMYSSLLKTAVQSAGDALASAGITASEDGRLTFDPEKFSSAELADFLNTVSTAAGNLSTYASSIFTSGSSLLDFLGTDESDSSLSAADYYGSLINTLT
ncbi:MAG: hypothetical protein IJT87_11510 [Ruminiclostridium sp.]|nr:hypothetical protein [Ruminiclostridium sp.]